jgi:hypothetical protein
MSAYDSVYHILKMGDELEEEPGISSKLTMPSDDNNPKTQMHQQLSHEEHGEGVKSAMDALLAAVMDELKHRDKKDDDIIE